MTQLKFQPRKTIEQVEESTELAPKFGEDGLMPCITTDAATGDVLMLGWMNAEAFRLTIETGEAHYFSRSRQVMWHKGATSGLVQKVVDARIDDDRMRCGCVSKSLDQVLPAMLGTVPVSIGQCHTVHRQEIL
jgi:phosphoribosyl-AMP cyclohydrolase